MWIDENDSLSRIERLEQLLLTKPSGMGCIHTFPLWMVIPPGGCMVNCPVCGASRFVQGTQIHW